MNNSRTKSTLLLGFLLFALVVFGAQQAVAQGGTGREPAKPSKRSSRASHPIATVWSSADSLAATNSAGDRLEITGFNPSIPADAKVLRNVSKIKVSLAYTLASGADAFIDVTPKFRGREVLGSVPSGLIQKGSGKISYELELEGKDVDLFEVNLATNRREYFTLRVRLGGPGN